MHALDDPECRVGTLQLLAQQREADVVHPTAAVVLRDRGAQEPLLGHLLEHAPGEAVAGVPLADVGQDLGFGEGPGSPLDQPVLVGEREVDHGLHRTRPGAATGQAGRR